MAEGTLEAPPAEPAPEVDGARQPLLDALRASLGPDLLGSVLQPGDDLVVRVARASWHRAMEFCRDRLGMTYFCFLAGLDWQPNPGLLGEKAWEAEEAVIEQTEEAIEEDVGDPDAAGADAAAASESPVAETAPTGRHPTGVAGGDSRFQVFVRLFNVATHVGITLKADLDDDDPRIDSLVDLFRGADWHERESWEMYGFQFDGHPRLRHLYLPSEFEGHPLRKDFPLLARLVKPWPGLVDVEPIPGDGDGAEEEA